MRNSIESNHTATGRTGSADAARKRKLEIAKFEHALAQHGLDDSQDQAIVQVSRYYSNTKLAIRPFEVAAMLLEASKKSYEQTLEPYQNGLSSLPSVSRNLDWVRLAQRFPVRIQLQNPDECFRSTASAVVTITGLTQSNP